MRLQEPFGFFFITVLVKMRVSLWCVTGRVDAVEVSQTFVCKIGDEPQSKAGILANKTSLNLNHFF